MNKRTMPDLVDTVAIALQQLRVEGKVDNEQPLLRIDNRSEAANAPYQFDTINTKIHRTSCFAIPRSSRSALFALWNIKKEDMKYACDKCRPKPDAGNSMEDNNNSNLLFGVLSIIDQFGSVLNERGREYRSSERGLKVEKGFQNILSELDKKQSEALHNVLELLDNVLAAANTLNENIKDQSNGKNGNGTSENHP